MATIAPIQTWYHGCLFRSRIEARWATFMDTLGIRWEYEKEGYEFTEGAETLRYLPDFWLPDLKQWLEIKGVTPSILECHLADRLSQLGYPVTILWGNILDHKGYSWVPGEGYSEPDANWFACGCRLTGLAPVRDADCDCDDPIPRYYNDRLIHNAYIAARSARFEWQRDTNQYRSEDDL